MLVPVLLQQAAVLQASGTRAPYRAESIPRNSCSASAARPSQSHLFHDEKLLSISRRSPVGQRAPVTKNCFAWTSRRSLILSTVAMAAATGNSEASAEDKRIGVLFVCLGEAWSPAHGHVCLMP